MGPTPEPESIPARLDISGGKSATFEPVRKTCKGKIVVKPSQSQSSNLTVYTVPNKEDQSVSMAFCFELKQKKYVLGVEKKHIFFEIQEQSELKVFSRKFLFRFDKNNKAQYGSLCSLAEPNQYLCVRNQEVTLSGTPDHGFKVSVLEQVSINYMQTTVQNIRGGLTCHTRMRCRRWTRKKKSVILALLEC